MNAFQDGHPGMKGRAACLLCHLFFLFSCPVLFLLIQGAGCEVRGSCVLHEPLRKMDSASLARQMLPPAPAHMCFKPHALFVRCRIHICSLPAVRSSDNSCLCCCYYCYTNALGFAAACCPGAGKCLRDRAVGWPRLWWRSWRP